jgi:hypothetical protein
MKREGIVVVKVKKVKRERRERSERKEKEGVKIELRIKKKSGSNSKMD